MEENNYDQYIDPNASDVQIAADRYRAEVERLDALIARYNIWHAEQYPPTVSSAPLHTIDVSACTISNYIISHAGTSGDYTTNVDYNAINELKETVDLLHSEIAELKRILKATIDNSSHQEHRKLTL